MTNLNTNSVEVAAAGGFRIEIRPDELIVVSDRSAFDSNGKKRQWMIFVLSLIYLILNLSLFMDPEFHHALSSVWKTPRLLFNWPPNDPTLRSIFFLLCVVAIIVSVVYGIFKSKTRLHCTPEAVELIFMFRDRVRRTYSYAHTEIKHFQYDAGLSVFLGTTGSLTFFVNGRKISCLRGLKCMEGQRILEKLIKMKYDVVRDPGMSMLLEMEQTRRKSPFNLIP
jgi:hypothetical protein